MYPQAEILQVPGGYIVELLYFDAETGEPAPNVTVFNSIEAVFGWLEEYFCGSDTDENDSKPRPELDT